MILQRVLVFEMHVTHFELCDLFAYAWGLSERERPLRKALWDMVGHRLGTQLF